MLRSAISILSPERNPRYSLTPTPCLYRIHLLTITSKSGFVRHHGLHSEISESYRLLFGSDRRSQTYFLELEASNPCNGFFNIFTLPNCDYEPRFLYNVTSDFPVFGDRLLVLKKLCVPTGILGLWRDKRDSLQWYTFWAVVFLGCFGAIVAFLQLGLSAIQTWATVAALNPRPPPN
jgi:hypothetical protein